MTWHESPRRWRRPSLDEREYTHVNPSCRVRLLSAAELADWYRGVAEVAARRAEAQRRRLEEHVAPERFAGFNDVLLRKLEARLASERPLPPRRLPRVRTVADLPTHL